MRLVRRRAFGPLAFSLIGGSVLSLACFVACSGDGASNAGSDSGSGSDGNNADSTVFTGDAASSDSGGSDGGSKSDASSGDGGGGDGGTPKGPITTCTSPVQLDVGPSAPPIAVVGYQGKWLALWNEASGSAHVRGRYFDGAALGGSVIDFGAAPAGTIAAKADGAGKAYFLTNLGTGKLARSVFDLTTGTPLSSSPTTFSAIDQTSYGVGAFAQGAVAVYNIGSSGPQAIDEYKDGGWNGDNDGGADGGVFATGHIATDANVALNADHKGAAWWLDSGPGNTEILYIVPYDGTSFGAPITRTFTDAADGGASRMTAAALSNGDIAFAWYQEQGGDATSVYHFSTSSWDTDLILYTRTTTEGLGGPQIFADADDDITVLWGQGISGMLEARRRIGGVWSANIPIGATAAVATGAIDSGGNVIAIMQFSADNPKIARIAKGATTVATPVATALPADQQPVAITFDGAGNPVLVGWGTAGFNVFASTCE